MQERAQEQQLNQKQQLSLNTHSPPVSWLLCTDCDDEFLWLRIRNLKPRICDILPSCPMGLLTARLLAGSGGAGGKESAQGTVYTITSAPIATLTRPSQYRRP